MSRCESIGSTDCTGADIDSPLNGYFPDQGHDLLAAIAIGIQRETNAATARRIFSLKGCVHCFEQQAERPGRVAQYRKTEPLFQ